MRIEGRLPATVVSQVQVQERGPQRQRLPPSPDLHEPIGFLRILYRGQQLLCLTMDTFNELLIGIAYPVTQQDCFSQPAQDAGFDEAKPQPIDQQSSGFPDNFILEDEVL
jgi:hypothetical protein